MLCRVRAAAFRLKNASLAGQQLPPSGQTSPPRQVGASMVRNGPGAIQQRSRLETHRGALCRLGGGSEEREAGEAREAYERYKLPGLLFR
jgi:hypothetical protein